MGYNDVFFASVKMTVFRPNRDFFTFFRPNRDFFRKLFVRKRCLPEFLGVFPKIQGKEAAKIELKSDLLGALLDKNPQKAVNHGVMNRGTL